uniref:Uncharacterized protein n=1 Tax=Vombatus ursinus TaxID=29139 RepID=A0A4X2LKJ1_VOMUR
MMSMLIILLKEVKEGSERTPQLVSNISASQVIVKVVCTTLGPQEMNEFIVNARVLCGRRLSPPKHHSGFPHNDIAGN